MTPQNKKSGSLSAELYKVRDTYNQIGLEDPVSGTVGTTTIGLDEYFAEGERQLAGILARGQTLGIAPNRGCALDFACGIGRVTRALGQQFAEVHGLDIAPSMIALANKHNTNTARCHFHLHCDDQLDLFADGSFDLIVAINVLRYISRILQRGYVREFIRLIRPNGLVYFETCEAVGLRTLFPESLLRAYRDFRQSHNTGPRRQDRYQFAEADVRRLISESGGEVLGVDTEPCPTLWRHCGFFVTKRRAI